MNRAKTPIGPGGFIELKKGASVSHGGKACRIRRLLSVESVVIQYLDSEETARVHPIELRPIGEASEKVGRREADNEPAFQSPGSKKSAVHPSRYDLADDDITEEDWKEARRKYAIIEPLIEKPNRTRADVERIAKTHNLSAATMYEWLKDYRDSGHVSGLIEARRGRPRGTRLLSPEQEEVIDEVLDEYLDPQCITPADVIERVNSRCAERGIKPPHPNTIRNRIADVPLKRRIGSRGNKDQAKQLAEPRPGQFPDGNYPLETVQIDHVQLNIKAVDEETRDPIEARPWLTLAIDCFTRMIVGYFLSLLRPTAFAAGVCLYMGMMPKRELLAELGLPGRWPVYGKFRRIHADNAKEFKGKMLELACTNHNIDLQLRAVKKPHYGAYIERMVGNVNRELHKKFGTTHSSPHESPDYDSSEKSAYTLGEIEKEIVDWIVNKYHVRVHSSLGTTCLGRWEQSLLGDAKKPGIGLPPIPADPEKLRLDFMPYARRCIHPYGVEIDNRTYYHEVLARWMGAPDPDNPTKKRKFIFRYDPRTIRKLWFWDPEVKRYFEIPLRNSSWPDISWSEYDERCKMMLKEGHQHVDEEAILGYTKRSKEREREALEKTRAVRRGKTKPAPKGATRKPENTAPGSNLYAGIPGKTLGRKNNQKENDPPDTDDLFDQPAVAFDDIEV